MPGFNVGLTGSAADPNANVETSRKHRWVLEVLEPLQSDLLVFAHKSGRPTVEIDRVTMHHGQDEIYSPGKQRWNPIEMSFYEVHSASGTNYAAKSIYAWWSKAVINVARSRVVKNFKKNGKLYMLDGRNQKVWLYNIYGCWPSKVSPDSLDYTDSSISEITVTLQMDKAQEVELLTQIIPLPNSCDPVQPPNG